MRFTQDVADDVTIDLTPLIDVVFTLLIFFMVTTTFEQRSLLKVDLPEASSEPVSEAKRGLLIVVDREGRYYIDSNEVLNPSLETLKAAIEKTAGNDRESPVTLRADARTPHQSVVTAMDALGQLGFANLSIATTPPAGNGN